MITHTPEFVVRLADCPEDIIAAQRLRYDVFVTELSAHGPQIDHSLQVERDRFDDFAAHLLLEDIAQDAPIRLVGVYRLLTADRAASAGGFYSDAEFDVSSVVHSGRSVLELGRSCLHAAYRGGAALQHLWQGLTCFVVARDIDVLFGVASFHGTDIDALAQPLSHLHYTYQAPSDMRPLARPSGAVSMARLPQDQVDRKAAMLATPALIKAYLRLGGLIGQDAYVDRAFNTTDVCLVLDTAKMNAHRLKSYGQGDIR